MPARISTLMRRRALASSLAAGAVSGAARRDEMLDDITLYWLTNTAGSSARLYWENNNNNNFNAVEQKTAEISTHMPMFEYTARRAGTSPPGRSRSCSQESFGLPSNHFASW